MSHLPRKLVVLSLVATVSCAPQQPRPTDAGPMLSTTARLEIVTVRGQDSTADVDAPAMLREALQQQLERRGIAWTGSTGERYGLELEILRYQAGNAFQRWLVPGLGATVLNVRGTLRGPDGSPAGGFEHGRGVYAGGAFTIGAWKTIFESVASDIARDLDRRIHRQGFTVSLKPWSAHDHEVPIAGVRREYGSVHARDLRTDRSRIGTRTAAFGVSMGDVFLARDVDEYVAEAVSDQLRAAGHRVGVSGLAGVQVDVTTFDVHTDTTPLYWDVIAEISAGVRAGAEPARALSCRAVRRTWAWPADDLVGAVLDDCLEELLSKLVDAVGGDVPAADVGSPAEARPM